MLCVRGARGGIDRKLHLGSGNHQGAKAQHQEACARLAWVEMDFGTSAAHERGQWWVSGWWSVHAARRAARRNAHVLGFRPSALFAFDETTKIAR